MFYAVPLKRVHWVLMLVRRLSNNMGESQNIVKRKFCPKHNLTFWKFCPTSSPMSANHLDWELVDRLAEGLAVEYWARRKWRQRNHIPHKWRLEIIRASRGRIRPEHFHVMDKNNKGRAA
jgi:hypothetical protein